MARIERFSLVEREKRRDRGRATSCLGFLLFKKGNTVVPTKRLHRHLFPQDDVDLIRENKEIERYGLLHTNSCFLNALQKATWFSGRRRRRRRGDDGGGDARDRLFGVLVIVTKKQERRFRFLQQRKQRRKVDTDIIDIITAIPLMLLLLLLTRRKEDVREEETFKTAQLERQRSSVHDYQPSVVFGGLGERDERVRRASLQETKLQNPTMMKLKADAGRVDEKRPIRRGCVLVLESQERVLGRRADTGEPKSEGSENNRRLPREVFRRGGV